MSTGRPPLVGRDAGSVTPLVLGFVAVLVALLAVMTDSSAAFLARRSLAAAADGAALHAVDGVDRGRLYDESLVRLPVDPALATARARSYLTATDLPTHYRHVSVTSVALDPTRTTVTVRLSAVVRLPFSGWLTGGRKTLLVQADASARSPLR